MLPTFDDILGFTYVHIFLNVGLSRPKGAMVCAFYSSHLTSYLIDIYSLVVR